MWILQEYRFYIIIAVIALASIIALFFSLYNRNDYISYSSKVKENDALISQISQDYNLEKVISPDGSTLAGTNDNSLFGKVLSGSIDDIRIVSKSSLDVLDTYNLDKGSFKLTYASVEGFPEGIKPIDEMWVKKNDILSIYTFDSPETAIQIQEQYLPSSKVKDNSVYISLETEENKDIDEKMQELLYVISPEEVLTSLLSAPSDWNLVVGTVEPFVAEQSNPDPIIEEPATLTTDLDANNFTLRNELHTINGDILLYEALQKRTPYNDFQETNNIYWKAPSDIGDWSIGTLVHNDPTKTTRNIYFSSDKTAIYYFASSNSSANEPGTDLYKINVADIWTGTPTLISSHTWFSIYPYSSSDLWNDLVLVKTGSAGAMVFDLRNETLHNFFWGYLRNLKYSEPRNYLSVATFGSLYLKSFNHTDNVTSTRNAVRVLNSVFPDNYAGPYVYTPDGEYIVYANSRDGRKLYMVRVSDLYTINAYNDMSPTGVYGTAITTVGASSVTINSNGNIVYTSIDDWQQYVINGE